MMASKSFDIQRVNRQSAQSFTLDAELLNRISLVYAALRDVLFTTEGNITSLEEFEKSFLQCNSPGEDVGVWESIAAALEKARLYYPPEGYDRKMLYRRLLFMLFGALTHQQLHEGDSRILMRCYRSSSTKRGGATAPNDPVVHFSPLSSAAMAGPRSLPMPLPTAATRGMPACSTWRASSVLPSWISAWLRM